jgi:hypothetical protein
VVNAATVEVPRLWRDRVWSVMWTAASYDVPTTFGAGVVSLKLMKGRAMSRTIKHMNPLVAVPHITGADT